MCISMVSILEVSKFLDIDIYGKITLSVIVKVNVNTTKSSQFYQFNKKTA